MGRSDSVKRSMGTRSMGPWSMPDLSMYCEHFKPDAGPRGGVWARWLALATAFQPLDACDASWAEGTTT